MHGGSGRSGRMGPAGAGSTCSHSTTTTEGEKKLGMYGSRLACHRTTGRQTDTHVVATLLYPFPGPASSPCPFTLAARPNTIIRDLGRGVPMGGAATFLASPWGGGSNAATRQRWPGDMCDATALTLGAKCQGSMAILDQPWARRTGVAGFACRARGDKKKPKDETRTAIVTSWTFWPPIPQLRVWFVCLQDDGMPCTPYLCSAMGGCVSKAKLPFGWRDAVAFFLFPFSFSLFRP